MDRIACDESIYTTPVEQFKGCCFFSGKFGKDIKQSACLFILSYLAAPKTTWKDNIGLY